MEVIESKEGIYDGQTTQCFRYHPTLAPKGRRFWTDELPDEAEGWVDTPAKFPGFKQPYGRLDPDASPAARDAPTECFRYHKDHGAKRFWTNELPREEDGWFDSPTKAANWIPADLVIEDTQPDPSGFTGFNAFMEAWCKAVLTDDMPPTKKAESKKEGIEAYVKAKHGIDIDRRKKLEDLVAEAEALE